MIRRLLAVLLFASPLAAQESRQFIPPVVASVDSSEIAGFATYPPAVKSLLDSALALTRQNLGYKFGSANPDQGGMDCSGTIFYLLQQAGVKTPPRSSDRQYVWVRRAGTFRAVLSRKMTSFELEELQPGDLLFWSGTYNAKREIPVTHTMIYLGKAKRDGRSLMVGASDGRSYRGKKCYGVSVFDFVLPSAESPSRFVGYAKIPGLNTGATEPPEAAGD